MSLFCWPPSVDIFNILPGFLWSARVRIWAVHFSLHFFSFLFFFFSFFFSFTFHFRYNSFVMFLYIAHNFWLTNFLLGFTCRSPKSFARSCVLRISSSYVVRLMVPIFLVHIWNDLPPPLKSQEEGTRNASAILSFLDAVTCHRNMFGCATGSPTTTITPRPPPQKSVDSLIYPGLLVTFYFALILCSFSFTTTKSSRTPIIHDYYLA